MCLVQSLLEARTRSQRSVHVIALCHIRIHWEKHIIPEKTEQALGNDSDSLPGSPWCHRGLFLFSIAQPWAPPPWLLDTAGPRCVVTPCTSTSTKGLKTWVFAARKRNVNEHASFFVGNQAGWFGLAERDIVPDRKRMKYYPMIQLSSYWWTQVYTQVSVFTRCRKYLVSFWEWISTLWGQTLPLQELGYCYKEHWAKCIRTGRRQGCASSWADENGTEKKTLWYL